MMSRVVFKALKALVYGILAYLVFTNFIWPLETTEIVTVYKENSNSATGESALLLSRYLMVMTVIAALMEVGDNLYETIKTK